MNEQTTQGSGTTQAAKGSVDKAKEEVKYQHYQSSLESVRVVAPNGTPITFVNFQFITADQYLIDFLNKEIKSGGMRDISIGAVMTREEADPMSALKAKWEKEWEEKQKAKAVAAALGKVPDLGNTIVKETGSTVQPVGGATSKQVASGASAG